MSSDTHPGFRIGRLRFLRPPPAWVELSAPSKKPSAVVVQLAIGLTDDYGVQLDSFDSLDLKLDLVDSETSAPLPSLALTPSTLTLRPSQSPFHTVKASLSATRSNAPWPKSFRIKLSVVASSAGTKVEQMNGTDDWMLKVLGEEGQEASVSWEDEEFVFLSALSGEVELRKGAGGEGKASDEKVQTILRTVHLPTATQLIASTSHAQDQSQPPRTTATQISPIRVVERPGLNNSTGQRLWDCAICLSAYLAQNRAQLWPSSDEDSAPSEPAAKRARKNEPFLQVIELGAGCGTVSLAAARLLGDLNVGAGAAEVISTDVEVTVDTTLKENLDFNRVPSSSSTEVLHPSARTLDWGSYSCAELDALFAPPPTTASTSSIDRTLIGSDILYNPESHSLLLETLLSFMRPKDGQKNGLTKALIGYRRRTEGDDNFFAIASEAGLEVRRVWSWGQVEVWEFR